MFMVDLIQWWYFRGWGTFASGFKHKLQDLLDFFSIGQLFQTLFMPYRQISATTSAEMTGSHISAFLDRLVSRIVGFFTRIFIIIFGGISILIEALVGTAFVVVWPLLPFLIVIGIVLAVMGVTF
ncbi:hypothetical protein IJG79_00835 [Candidatus Saccharibacteria bacterium]|nr:hypothetical protein [Candidatus Saccharibacteria bacterium]